ncbi:hypothetical protein ZIOFF_037945 [Zingiber officinale]|uniref:Transcription repressor n=1 Tax=Zingiber officinale TaxID=94328 RepID=A0A8J5GDW7_ZINOF|nr:hypothetical protein ZIOFF_037945 [Zingiber officinale]
MPSNLVRFSNSGHPAASAVHRLLSASKYPSTPSMGPGRRPGATLSDIDRFLRNNFRSLYVHDDEAPPGSAPWSDATAPSSSSSSDEKSEGVTVTTVSVDPYRDFRRSMEEMMEARHADAADLDWDFMEELLLCYLDLNHERVHKHILRAFADLAISFGRSRRWRSAVTEGKEQARTSSPQWDDEKEEGKEVVQQWEDDDVNDDFSLQLKQELESNSSKS